MRGESGSGSGRIGLDSIALIEQSLIIKLLEQPPKGLDVFVVVSDIGMVKVNEIAHLFGQFAPFGRKLHHILTTFVVIVLHRDILAGSVVVDISLCDAQFLFHTKFHRESVGVPTSLSVHLETFHRLVAVESILDGAGEHMVDSGMTVGRRRSLEEDKLRASFPFVNALVEDVELFPVLEHILIYLCQIQSVMYGKFRRHCCLVCIYIIRYIGNVFRS